MNVYECPNCGGMDSERYHSEMLRDKAIQIRGCNQCLTEWTVEYADPLITETRSYEE